MTRSILIAVFAAAFAIAGDSAPHSDLQNSDGNESLRNSDEAAQEHQSSANQSVTPAIIAHRGLVSPEAPENTLSAFRAAVEAGFGFECDIRLSADGKLFTFHDKDLSRVTGGADTRRPEELAWDELSRLSTPPPALLEEVLTLARDGRWMYLDVKNAPHVVPFLRDAMTSQGSAHPGNTLFLANGPGTAAALRRELPDYKTLLIAQSGETAAEAVARAKGCGASGVDARYDLKTVDAAFVATLREAGLECHVWGVNDPDMAVRAFADGVASITTDKPAEIAAHSDLRNPDLQHSAFSILHSSFAVGGGGVPAASPYGVCAHLHRVKDPAERTEECRWIASTGISRVRFDLEWWRVQKSPGASFDFSHYDAVVADAEAAGLTPLPILFDIPKWAEPVWEHLDEWGAFVEAVVSHYGDRLPDIEIWNEENHRHFWKHEPSPENYCATLRTAYEAAKRANSRVRVLFGGTAGVPLGFIEDVYKAGGAPYFDAMNIHPYNHPRPPEGHLDVKLEQTRALMARYGDAGKPLLLTELGWPTHDASLGAVGVLRAGLKVARPEQKSWRAVYAAASQGWEGGLPTEIAEAIEKALPPGSSCEACFGARLRERLAAGDVDLVVYPFDETFPVDTFEEVLAFVDAGGVLIDAGGMPMWYPVAETAPGIFVGSADKSGRSGKECREALGIDVTAWWLDPALTNAAVKANPTEAALAAGFLGDPAGEDADRFQTPHLLAPGDEFIPLLSVKDANGRDVAAASVIRRAGGRRGCVIVSGLRPRGAAGTNSEDNQARYLVRAMGIAFAEGVEQYYWYEFRGREIDPQYSEHHFGLTHPNFTPKPAWGAYRNFILARPAGSVQAAGPWHDDARSFFFPQWTRPDGTKAGVLWTTGKAGRRELRFDGDGIRFRDYTGRAMRPTRSAAGDWAVPVSAGPVFFEGGFLLP